MSNNSLSRPKDIYSFRDHLKVYVVSFIVSLSRWVILLFKLFSSKIENSNK